MIAKKELPYYQDNLVKAFENQFPKYSRTKIFNQWERFTKTNQNNQKGNIKR